MEKSKMVTAGIRRRQKKIKQKSVLLVEKDIHLRKIIITILEHFNLNTIVAKNAKEGLKKYKKHRHKIIVVIINLSLPKMNGVKLIEDLIELNDEVKIVIFASHKNLNKVQPRYMKNIVGILEIPFKSPTLAMIIKNALK